MLDGCLPPVSARASLPMLTSGGATANPPNRPTRVRSRCGHTGATVGHGGISNPMAHPVKPVLNGHVCAPNAVEAGAAEVGEMGAAVLASAREGPRDEDEYSDPDDPGYLRETAVEVKNRVSPSLPPSHTIAMRSKVPRAPALRAVPAPQAASISITHLPTANVRVRVLHRRRAHRGIRCCRSQRRGPS